jgi:lysozyme family protein
LFAAEGDMSEDQLIAEVFVIEGDVYGDQHTHPPIDQPTAGGGIVLETLRDYVTATGSTLPVTVDTLRNMTHEQAVVIVRWKLQRIVWENHLGQIPFEPLRLQMIDFIYNSGPGTAWKWLQSVLRVEPDGDPGPLTMEAIMHEDLWLVNQALVGARLQFIDRWTDKSAQRKAWEEGLESRGLLFSLLEIPKGY